MSEPIMIGVDHGYAAMKKLHTVRFPLNWWNMSTNPTPEKVCWSMAESFM